jgi:hypothetical protein
MAEGHASAQPTALSVPPVGVQVVRRLHKLYRRVIAVYQSNELGSLCKVMHGTALRCLTHDVGTNDIVRRV